MTRRWPVFGVALAILWLFVRGVALDPTRWLAEFLTGLLFGLPIAFFVRRWYRDSIELGRIVRAIPFVLAYLALFLRELLTANVDVAYRVLAPSMPIEPDVIEVPLRVESDVAITTIANSITLTPGTLTMDYDNETNTLFVHAISGDDRDAVLQPIRAWEDYALRIFDEEARPRDPAPPRPSDRIADEDGSAAGSDGAAADDDYATESADEGGARDG